MDKKKFYEMETTEFHKYVATTSLQRIILEKWVKDGNSPLDNPFGYYRKRDPFGKLNFVEALEIERRVKESGRFDETDYPFRNITFIEQMRIDDCSNYQI